MAFAHKFIFIQSHMADMRVRVSLTTRFARGTEDTEEFNCFPGGQKIIFLCALCVSVVNLISQPLETIYNFEQR